MPIFAISYEQVIEGGSPVTWSLTNRRWVEYLLLILSRRFIFMLMGVIGIWIGVFCNNGFVYAAGVAFLVIDCALYAVHYVNNDSCFKG
jgi:hypothetical protein